MNTLPALLRTRAICGGLALAFLFQSLIGYCATASAAAAHLPHSAQSLPANPASAEIAGCMVFAGPLVATVGQPPRPGENAALSAALKKYAARSEEDNLSSITGFLDEYPASTWKASLLTNLGTVYYCTGHFDSALDAWETAWNTAKSSKDPAMRAIADWAVSQFARMNARLGRYQRLVALFTELKGRKLQGGSAEYLLAAREGYALMMLRPEKSFRCGPLAVRNVLAF